MCPQGRGGSIPLARTIFSSKSELKFRCLDRMRVPTRSSLLAVCAGVLILCAVLIGLKVNSADADRGQDFRKGTFSSQSRTDQEQVEGLVIRSPEELSNELIGLIDMGGVIHRTADEFSTELDELSAFVDALRLEEVSSLVHLLREETDPKTDKALAWLFQKWAKLASVDAAEYVRAYLRDAPDETERWMSGDDALYIKKLPHERDGSLLGLVYRTWAKKDSLKAWEHLCAHGTPRRCTKKGSSGWFPGFDKSGHLGVIHHLAQDDPEVAVKGAIEFLREQESAFLMNRLLQSLPTASVDWEAVAHEVKDVAKFRTGVKGPHIVLGLPVSNSKLLASRWMESDPVAALQWYGDLTGEKGGRSRELTIQFAEIGTQWLRREPERAIRWVEGDLIGKDESLAQLVLLSALGSKVNSKALELGSRLKNQEERFHLLSMPRAIEHSLNPARAHVFLSKEDVDAWITRYDLTADQAASIRESAYALLDPQE